jgi:hypothetical protein
VSISALPPPPQLGGPLDSDIGEPWVTTAADLLADLLADPARGETLVATGNAALDADGGLGPGTLTALLAGPGPAATAALAAAAHHAAYHHDVVTLLYPLRCTAAATAAHLAHAHGTTRTEASATTSRWWTSYAAARCMSASARPSPSRGSSPTPSTPTWTPQH